MDSDKNTTNDSVTSIDEIDLTNLDNISISSLETTLKDIAIPNKPVTAGLNTGLVLELAEQDVPGSPPEPVFTSKIQRDIQGNTIPGFNKDHQHYLFYRISSKSRTKTFLKWLEPYISSMEEVIAFRNIFRQRRLRLGHHHTFLSSTWVNIAFSADGLRKLTSEAEVDQFGEQSFKQGLAERSSYLGDPTDSSARGNERNWVVGGTKNEADIIIIVASDSSAGLDGMVKTIKKNVHKAAMKLIFEQRGETLPGQLRGHEHFGFRDGISQPGVRGKLSANPGHYITPRYIDHNDPRRLYFSKPGQLLTWPGQYILGMKRQDMEHLYNSAPAANNFPKWAVNGSFLVVRRLHQDVRLFWGVMNQAAASLGMNPTKFASMMVGRWPSGAPLMRSPNADDPALGADEFANNHFLYDDDTDASQLRHIPGYQGDNFPQAQADFLAQVCPHFAHIRKIQPRESVTDLGKPEDNLIRMILRRGIPYGPPIVGKKLVTEAMLKADRGLMFLSYSSTIEDQFEFLQRRWSNSTVQPNFGGHDPIIGQNGTGTTRTRFIDFPSGNGNVKRIKFGDEWVTPTGGGYFFSPSISAIKTVLSV